MQMQGGRVTPIPIPRRLEGTAGKRMVKEMVIWRMEE